MGTVPISFDLHYRAQPGRVLADEHAFTLESPVTREWLKLDEYARAVWDSLEYAATAGEVGSALAARYDASSDEITKSVLSVIERLEPLGLVAASAPGDRPRERYLRLLKRALVNLLYPELEMQLTFLRDEKRGGLEGVELKRHLRDLRERDPEGFAALQARKLSGMALAHCPHTMIGHFRLTNIERCAERIFADGIEGDFLEAGVCQGGATIFMRGLQVAHDEGHRRTWVVDSFAGLPPSDTNEDCRYNLHLEEEKEPWLACSEATVREHFTRYDLLDEGVVFVAGWVAESLPTAPIGPLAMLRLDVDLYSSTRECLDHLYDKVTPGGFIIVDDYAWLECCRDAVDDFRASRGITDPISWIDGSGVFWRKGDAPARATQ